MFWEIFIAIIAGVSAGAFTGLIPGIHVNLIALIAISISPFLLTYTTPFTIIIFIFSLAITHTFLDSIPSIFLGAPDAAMVLSVLPGHRFLLEGKGKEAVYLTLLGSLGTAILSIFLFPLFVLGVPIIYGLIKNSIGYILLIAISFFILRESSWKARGLALTFFLTAGILGIISTKSPHNPLLPLLGGLFGTSTLLLSLNDKNITPKQQDACFYQFPETILKHASTAILSGGITSFLPGIGSAQATLFAKFLTTYEPDTYLITVGGVNTANFILSLASFFTIGRARNGAVVAMQTLMDILTIKHILVMASVTLLVAGAATLLGMKLTDLFARFMEVVDYDKLCIGVLLFISLLTFILSGIIGIIILITATALGVLCQTNNVSRHHLMGCLLLPTLMFFL